MNDEQEKAKVIEEIIKSFREEGINIASSEIRTASHNGVWLVWIEQSNGLDTSGDKIMIPLSHLVDGVNYSLAAGNRVKTWAHPLNGFYTGEIPAHLLDEERLEVFKEEWVGRMVRLPQQGEGPVLDVDYWGMLTIAITGPSMVSTKQIHHSKVQKL